MKNDKLLTLKQQDRKGSARRYLLAFMLPAAFLLLLYGLNGVMTDGKQPLMIDLYHQYAPFLAQFKRVLNSGESLLFTFRGGLGYNFFGVFTYYLASPLNLLLLIVPYKNLAEMVLFLIVFKCGLAGLSAYYFLNDTAATHRMKQWVAVALSTAWALNGFFLAQSWNIMWSDAFYLMPLILIGLKRFIRGKAPTMYILSLFALLAMNYYVGLFVCIFTLLFFFSAFYSEAEDRRPFNLFKSFTRFALYSVIAALMAGIMLLPTWQQLQLTSATGDQFPQSLAFKYNIVEIIARGFPMMKPNVMSGTPNIYAGAFLFLMIPLYFLLSRDSGKLKAIHGGILGFILISFNVNVLDFLWHGMHYPNSLDHRYAFLVPFLGLYLAYRLIANGIYRPDSSRVKPLILLFTAGAILIALLVDATVDSVSGLSVHIFILFLALYAWLLSNSLKGKPRYREIWLFALTTVMLLEILTSTLVSFTENHKERPFGPREGYAAGTVPEELEEAIERLESGEKFVRMEVLPRKTVNDPALYGYNGLTVFASPISQEPVKVMGNIGVEVNGVNSYVYRDSGVLQDSIFGIKYLLRRSPTAYNDGLRQKKEQIGSIEVWENPYALSLGFAVSGEVPEDGGKLPYYGNPLDSLRVLAERLGYRNGLMTFYEPKPLDGSAFTVTKVGEEQGLYELNTAPSEDRQELHYTFTVPEDGEYMFGWGSGTFRVKDISWRENNQPRQAGTMARGTHTLGKLKAGTEIIFDLKLDVNQGGQDRMSIKVAKLDETELARSVRALRTRELKLNTFEDRNFSGKVIQPEDGWMFFSTPYHPGWRVTVDDQPAEPISVFGGFMGIPLAAGEHRVSASFRPPGLTAGLILTLIGFAACIAVAVLHHVRAYRAGKQALSEQIRKVEITPEKLRQITARRAAQSAPSGNTESAENTDQHE